MVHLNQLMQWYMVLELSFPSTADLPRPNDSESVGSVKERDGRRSTTVGFRSERWWASATASKQGAPVT